MRTRCDYDNEIIKLYNLGYSAYKISKELKISKPKVLKDGWRLGLNFSKYSKLDSSKIMLKDKKREIIDLFNSGLSCNQISKELNYSCPQISINLRKWGYHPTQNRYNVDDTFFDNINTEEKAYILGWWYSDGNVMKGKIRLQISDLEILEKIKNCFKYTGPISIIKPRKEGRKIQYLLDLSRVKLVSSIVTKGCLPQKSRTIKFPSEDIVPKHLLNHFIRGLSDGDGNIYYYKKKNRWKIQYCGTHEIIDGIIKNIGISGYWSKRHPGRDNNNYSFQIGKQSEIRKFLEYIYKDATIFLKRKKVLANQFLSSAAV